MRWRTLAVVIAVLAVALLLVAGPGTRFGLWNFRTGLSMLRWAFYAGVLGVVLALVALVVSRRAGVGALLVALVLAGIAVAAPWSFA